jgi:hypothetical protein
VRHPPFQSNHENCKYEDRLGCSEWRSNDNNSDSILMNNRSNYLLVLVLAFIGVTGTTPNVSAQTVAPREPACDVLGIDRLVGSISLSLGIDRAVTPIMSCLLNLWREDQGGNTKSVVSNAFLSTMAQNPRTFFSIMTGEPKIFAEWLDGLEPRSFVWPFDPPCQLETSRRHLILILQRSPVDTGRASSMKDTVVAKLSSIRCRQAN